MIYAYNKFYRKTKKKLNTVLSSRNFEIMIECILYYNADRECDKYVFLINKRNNFNDKNKINATDLIETNTLSCVFKYLRHTRQII